MLNKLLKTITLKYSKMVTPKTEEGKEIFTMWQELVDTLNSNVAYYSRNPKEAPRCLGLVENGDGSYTLRKSSATDKYDYEYFASNNPEYIEFSTRESKKYIVTYTVKNISDFKKFRDASLRLSYLLNHTEKLDFADGGGVTLYKDIDGTKVEVVDHSVISKWSPKIELI